MTTDLIGPGSSSTQPRSAPAGLSDASSQAAAGDPPGSQDSIYFSPEPDLVLPDATLVGYTLADARSRGDHPALIDAATGERMTYREFADAVDASAAALRSRGIGRGDVVTVVSHNQPGFALAFFAAARAGAAVSPANPLLTAEELAVQMRITRSRAVITAVPNASTTATAADDAAVGLRFVLGAHEGFTSFGDLPSEQATPVRDQINPALDPAVLPFSSGTTGAPKGVIITHRNVIANVEQHQRRWPLSGQDVIAGVLPLFHIYGLTAGLVSALRAGATLVTLPRYDLDSFLRMIEQHRITRAYLAPPIAVQLASEQSVDRYDLSSLRLAICGAAPLDLPLAARAEQRLGCRILQGYGLTEADPVALAPAAGGRIVPDGSVGPLVAGTTARVVDPLTGADMPHGEPGELWIRGPQTMSGYLDDPQATSDTIIDGMWVRTGDVVRIDRDDNVWIVDRLKEIIKYKGHQVAPAELEAVLMRHPSVHDAAVHGIAHLESGEVPEAVVVADPSLSAQALMHWVAELVAPYKKIRSVRFVDAIPKSTSGKILRRLLPTTPDRGGAVAASPGPTGKENWMSARTAQPNEYSTVSTEIQGQIGWL